MSHSEAPLLPIKEADYQIYRKEFTPMLKQVTWKPDKPKRDDTKIDLSFLIESKTLGIDQSDELSILKNAVRISDDRVLLSNATIYCLNAIRDGLCIGRYVGAMFEKASGLEQMLARNKTGEIHQAELPEFHDKMQTLAAIIAFVSSSYIVYRLNDYESEKVSAINMDFGGIPEIKLSRPTRAVNCMLYYYCAYLERSGVVKSDLEMVKMTLLYFERMIEEIQFRQDSLSFTEHFTTNHYKLEFSDFLVEGFDTGFSSAAHSIQFNPTRMEDIVANHEAKHMFKRYAERLLCHDLNVGKNPMLELGGLPSITMADGKPGTGKSMLIAATATFLKEKCDWLELPFLFWPLPENIISTYQGGSAERAMEWFRPMSDPNKIIFAPIDDAENNLEERTRRGVSAGVREFIGVFLRNTEGAYAINNGNRLISLFTNIPDQIDKAVLSRIQSRVSIDGAKSEHDFIDQDYIWWKKYREIMPKFMDASDPKSYEYMTDQQDLGSLSDIYEDDYEFRYPEIEQIFKSSKEKWDVENHGFFGLFYAEVLKQYPFFSSRDLRNIQKAIDARIIDIDFPDQWWEQPDQFFLKAYDEKLEMLKDLVKQSAGGLSFTQIRLREALNYIETAIRINESGIERDIEQTANQMYVQRKAQERLSDKTFMK